MSELLLKTVNMSVAASWLILAVPGLRFLLKKAPKRVNVLLWGIVAVRLVCPFSIESTFSLIPSAEIIPEAVMSGANFEIQTGLDHVDESINNYLGDLNLDGVSRPRNRNLANRWNGNCGNNCYGLCPNSAKSGRNRCSTDDYTSSRWNPACFRSLGNCSDTITYR